MRFRQMLTEGQKSVKYMVDFISKNQDLLDTYDVEDLWNKVTAKRFQKDTGYYVYVDIRRFKWEISSLGWELKNTESITYDEALKDFQKFMSKSNLSPQENKEKAEFDYITRHTTFDGKNTFKLYGSYNFDAVLRLLHYAATGTIDKDLGPVLKWMDQKGINSSSTFSNEPFEELGRNVTLTKFKNGKITVKGLPAKSISIINRIYKNSGK